MSAVIIAGTSLAAVLYPLWGVRGMVLLELSGSTAALQAALPLLDVGGVAVQADVTITPPTIAPDSDCAGTDRNVTYTVTNAGPSVARDVVAVFNDGAH